MTEQDKQQLLARWRERLAPLLSLHEKIGRVHEKDMQGKNWSNVIEHCLLEAARVDAFAALLKLTPAVREKLVAAAAVHDFYKRFEIEATREDIARGGTGRKGYLKAESEAEAHLKGAGLGESVVRLVGSVGGEPENIKATKRLVDRPELTDEEVAFLVMRYVDDYTRGADAVESARMGPDGQMWNEVDRRADRNRSNADYQLMDIEGLILYSGDPYFEDMTRFEAQAAAAHMAEKKLAELLVIRAGVRIDPLDVPEFIDRKLQEGLMGE